MTESVTIRLNEKAEFSLKSHENAEALNPKELLLLSAAKCAGMTLQYILKRERLTVSGLELTVSGQLSTEKLMPESTFKSFHAVYNVECSAIEEQSKVTHAVHLTHDKYCGLMRMLRMIAPLSQEIAVVSTDEVRA